MNLLTAAIAIIAGLMLILAGTTRIGAWIIERRNPPVGQFVTVNGVRMHYVHVPAENAELPPVIFIHGASSNLRDQLLPMRPLFEGRAELLFFDRPGYGWSSRGSGNETPFGQSDTIAALMDELGIGRAIVVGHSFGGGIAASFALKHPGKTQGLVLVSSASHPWPGGATSWYNDVATTPVAGWLFTETLTLPAGWARLGGAIACVFSPNPVPERYSEDAAISLVLRPGAFRSNAADVKGLYEHVVKVSPRYGEIDAPTVVISGDSDTVVYEDIHSKGLARDIPDAELVWVHNMGHKPDWTSPGLVAAAIEKVSGKTVDLQAMARDVEAPIADDAYATENCQDTKPMIGAQADG